jgi:hypothetical protein
LAWIEHTHAHGKGGTGTLGVDDKKPAEGKIECTAGIPSSLATHATRLQSMHKLFINYM